MRLAIFADIHANRPAFAACLEAARAKGAERIVCLGDIVGYGADPEWAVDTVMELAGTGAPVVRGNHDNAIGTNAESMNAEAQAAIEWTRGRLSAPARIRYSPHSSSENGLPAEWRRPSSPMRS